MLAIEVAVFLPEQVASVPAVAEDGTKLVVAGVEEFGDIGGEGLDALPVVRPSWHEEVLADFLAVEMEVGYAQRGPVEGGLPDRTGRSEGLSQIRARLPARGFP